MKKKRISLIIFIIGIVALLCGAGFLLFKILKQPDTRDAEFLVEVGTWVKEDDDRVVWNFTGIGEGSLTTNNHLNDYDFIWATEDNKLKIETSWLYDLEDEFEYTLDRGAKSLTLTSGGNTIVLTAEEKTEEEPATEAEEPTEE